MEGGGYAANLTLCKTYCENRAVPAPCVCVCVRIRLSPPAAGQQMSAERYSQLVSPLRAHTHTHTLSETNIFSQMDSSLPPASCDPDKEEALCSDLKFLHFPLKLTCVQLDPSLLF